MDHLSGEGAFNKPQDQVQAIPEIVLKDIKITVETALLNTPDDGTPSLNFADLKQEPNKTYQVC